MRLLSFSERQTRYDGHQSARTIFDTPYLRHFLDRADVQALRFKSGSFHVFVGDHDFVADTLLAATELAVAFDQARALEQPETPCNPL